MSWLTNYIHPKLSQAKTQFDIPDNLWIKCDKCRSLIFRKELENNLYVCPYCGFHLYLSPEKRFDLIFDNGKYQLLPEIKTTDDPLNFKDLKDYKQRLKEAREKTKQTDAFVSAFGSICGQDVIVGILDFAFIGGSMGTFVGEAFFNAIKIALERDLPFITITASGGARMQEGILSLMQMAKTTMAVKLLKNKHIPYIVVLTNPTTGGVSASFAMLGDYTIAEKDALIAFAGARVIKETIRADLPQGFQKAEYLKQHGMIDFITERKDLKVNLGILLNLLSQRERKL